MGFTKITSVKFLFECGTDGCSAVIEVDTRLQRNAIDQIKNGGWFYDSRHRCHCPKHWPKGNHQRRLEVA